MTEHPNDLTIVFADICKSSQLYDTYGNQKAQAIVGTILDRLTEVTHQNNGKIIKMMGDAIMCTFGEIEDAVIAAKAMQDATTKLYTANPDFPRINIHTGMHKGHVIIEGDDVFGDAGNLASRLAEISSPRQIVTTRATVSQLPPHLSDATKFVANITVKNIPGVVEVHEIVWEEQDLTVIMGNRRKYVSPISLLELKIGEQTIVVNPKNPAISVGRQPYNDIILDYPWISRTHITIEYRNGKFIITDKSSNGIIIDSDHSDPCFIHMDEHQLSGKGVIHLGKHQSTEEDEDKIYYNVKR